MRKRLVITIDGPAGVGKSTVSKSLADRLSYLYLDTGALYRAMAYKLTSERIDPSDETRLRLFLDKTEIRLVNSNNHLCFFVGDEDVTQKIRTESIGLAASTLSAIPIVREALFHIQRKVGADGGIVAEGRDMGTVVFPDADVKFFLEASESERIRRRYEELILRGEIVDRQKLAEGMSVRDRQDREREIAPLRAHPDALIIDSTSVSVNEVIEQMINVINPHFHKR